MEAFLGLGKRFLPPTSDIRRGFFDAALDRGKAANALKGKCKTRQHQITLRQDRMCALGGMVYGKKHRMWYGIVGGKVREKHSIGMVRWRYGTMVRCRGYIIWLDFPGDMVCFSI